MIHSKYIRLVLYYIRQWNYLTDNFRTYKKYYLMRGSYKVYISRYTLSTFLVLYHYVETFKTNLKWIISLNFDVIKHLNMEMRYTRENYYEKF